MVSALNTLKTTLDKVILILCGVAIISLVITVTWQVFSRYVLNDPSSFTDELARYTMIWFGLLGASYLFGKNGHLAITLFVGSVGPKYQKYCHLLINLVSCAFYLSCHDQRWQPAHWSDNAAVFACATDPDGLCLFHFAALRSVNAGLPSSQHLTALQPTRASHSRVMIWISL